MAKIGIFLRLAKETIDQLIAIAKREGRTKTNMIERLIQEHHDKG